jgi:hypothetical protein
MPFNFPWTRIQQARARAPSIGQESRGHIHSSARLCTQLSKHACTLSLPVYWGPACARLFTLSDACSDQVLAPLKLPCWLLAGLHVACFTRLGRSPLPAWPATGAGQDTPHADAELLAALEQSALEHALAESRRASGKAATLPGGAPASEPDGAARPPPAQAPAARGAEHSSASRRQAEGEHRADAPAAGGTEPGSAAWHLADDARLAQMLLDNEVERERLQRARSSLAAAGAAGRQSPQPQVALPTAPVEWPWAALEGAATSPGVPKAGSPAATTSHLGVTSGADREADTAGDAALARALQTQLDLEAQAAAAATSAQVTAAALAGAQPGAPPVAPAALGVTAYGTPSAASGAPGTPAAAHLAHPAPTAAAGTSWPLPGPPVPGPPAGPYPTAVGLAGSAAVPANLWQPPAPRPPPPVRPAGALAQLGASAASLALGDAGCAACGGYIAPWDGVAAVGARRWHARCLVRSVFPTLEANPHFSRNCFAMCVTHQLFYCCKVL